MKKLPQIEFRPICINCDCKKFKSGHSDLDKFFRNKALKRNSRLDSAVQVATPLGSDEVLSFYSLKLCAEPTKLLTGVHKSSLEKEQVFPAIELEWMAVDKKFQKQGLGARTLVEALSSSYQAFKFAGGYGVVLTPERGTEGFYEKYGFTSYGSGKSLRMIMPSATIVEMFMG